MLKPGNKDVLEVKREERVVQDESGVPCSISVSRLTAV